MSPPSPGHDSRRSAHTFALATLGVLLGLFLPSCSTGGAGQEEAPPGGSAAGEVVTWEVGPELVPCTGVAPQECMRVRDYPDGEWRLFYDQIEGFTYAPGFTYVIDVEITPVPNPPADGSSLRYSLVKIVEETPQ